jgi:hypothetical protein
MARGEVLERLAKLGLVGADGRERWDGHIIFPAFDSQGAVVQLAAYASDGRCAWLFPDETPVLWNEAALKSSPVVQVAADPLAALILIARGEEGVIAPAGPGDTLGSLAKDLLLAYAPRLVLQGCESLRGELGKLGILVEGGRQGERDFLLSQDENGLTAQFPRRLTFVIQGLHQDSPRHLRASIKVFRKPQEGVESSERPRLHLDTFDLYHARSRIGFAKTAACLLGEDPTLLEDYLGRLVTVAEDHMRTRKESTPSAVVPTPAQREEALALLRDPRFPERIGDPTRITCTPGRIR